MSPINGLNPEHLPRLSPCGGRPSYSCTLNTNTCLSVDWQSGFERYMYICVSACVNINVYICRGAYSKLQRYCLVGFSVGALACASEFVDLK